MVQDHFGCPGCDKTDNSHLFELLSEVIAKYKGREGSLIQILHSAQNRFRVLFRFTHFSPRLQKASILSEYASVLHVMFVAVKK
jgi:hypothetical protein